jgi:hypothetical protein
LSLRKPRLSGFVLSQFQLICYVTVIGIDGLVFI